MSRAKPVECRFFVPIRRDQEISDGELHTTEARNWLMDQLYERKGWVDIAVLYHSTAHLPTN